MTAAVMMPSPDPARLPAAVLAVFVHLLLFTFLFLGVRWSSTAPEAVMVELWVTPPVPEPVQEKVEPPPRPEPPKPVPKVEPRPEPKVEPKPAPALKKPDIAIEKEKKASKPKPEPPKQENLKFDLTARMREQLANELAKSAPRPEAAKPVSPPPSAPNIDSGYAARIRGKIRGNIVVPPEIQGDPEAIFDVVQLPTGEVISVRLRKSSGSKAYDDAIERAILKSSPLPRPDRPDQFQRQLELKFRPKDPL